MVTMRGYGKYVESQEVDDLPAESQDELQSNSRIDSGSAFVVLVLVDLTLTVLSAKDLTDCEIAVEFRRQVFTRNHGQSQKPVWPNRQGITCLSVGRKSTYGCCMVGSEKIYLFAEMFFHFGFPGRF